MVKSMFLALGTPLGVPFAPKLKSDPIVTAAALGAGASVLGNILGFGSASSANKTNLQIARENNAQQYQMFKEQNAFNLDMWNKNNEYNAPKQQVERLLAAGINPSAVFGNGSVTPASQIQSATAPQLQQAHVNPFSPDLSGVGDAANAYFQNKLVNANADKASTDTQIEQVNLRFRAQQIIGDLLEQRTRINNMISSTGKNEAEKDYLIKQKDRLEQQINYFNDVQEDLRQREKLQNDVLSAQKEDLLAGATLKRAQSNFQALISKYYPATQQAQIELLSNQATEVMKHAALMVSERNLTDKKQTEQLIENQIKNLVLHNERAKHGQFSNNSHLMRELKDFSSYVSGLIFENLKLFK